MIIPVGAIVELFEKLLGRVNHADAELTVGERMQQAAMMQSVASRLGAEFKMYGQQTVVIHRGTRVEARLFASAQGAAWSVGVPPPGFPTFQIEKRGTLSFLRKSVARGTILPLENAYTIQTNDAEALRAMWQDDVCEALRRLSPDAEVVCDGATIDVRCPGRVDADALYRGVQLCLLLGRSDVYCTQLLRDLPNSTFVENKLPFAHVSGPGEIRIGYFRERDVIVMRARAAIAQLTDDETARVKALGAATAFEHGELVVTWPSVVRDKERLLEAIALLQSAAVPRRGIFR